MEAGTNVDQPAGNIKQSFFTQYSPNEVISARD